MKIKQILDAIASLSGKNDKRDLLAKHKDNELLKEVIYKAHSPRVKYFIKKIPVYTSQALTEDSYTLEQMLVKIEAFSNRELTGNAAIGYLTKMLENSHPDDAYVIEKIIGKNLKIGMDTGYNKVIPNLLEETPYMGAKSFSEKLVIKLFENGEVRSDIKADGTYRNAIIRSNEVELVSRQGEVSVLEGAPFLLELAQMDDCVLNGELTIDGEPDRVTANGMVNSIMSILSKAEERGEKITAKKIAAFEEKHGSFEGAIQNLRYTVWDIITVDEYFAMKSDTHYKDRRNQLEAAITEDFKMVGVIESKIVATFEEAMEHFQEALARGLEGTILKATNKGWKGKGKGYKPTYQVKMKLEINIDLRIKGFLYGNVGTKNELVISRLMVESECGLLKTQPAGMKEAKMEWVTENQEVLMETVVEIRCCGLSKDSNGNWSCMHPSVEEFRADKDTCDTLESAQEIEYMAKTLKKKNEK